VRRRETAFVPSPASTRRLVFLAHALGPAGPEQDDASDIRLTATSDSFFAPTIETFSDCESRKLVG
jgi:hypothetical protein